MIRAIAILAALSAAPGLVLAQVAANPAGRWSDPPSLPATAGQGLCSAVVDEDTIFVIPGNGQSFLRYRPSRQLWEEVGQLPTWPSTGTCLVHRPGTPFLYLLIGSASNGQGGWGGAMYRYDSSDRVDPQWEPMAAVFPSSLGAGVELTTAADRLYAFDAFQWTGDWSFRTQLYVYDFATEGRGWVSAGVVPFLSYDSTRLVHPAGSFLYCVRGWGGHDFWRYAIETVGDQQAGTWRNIAYLPAPGWNCGMGTLLTVGPAGTLYCVPHDDGGNFPVDPRIPWERQQPRPTPAPSDRRDSRVFRFDIEPGITGGGTWTGPLAEVVPPESWQPRLGALVYPGSGDAMLLLRGINSRDVESYSISADRFNAIRQLQEPAGAGAFLVSARAGGIQRLYVLIGNGSRHGYRYTPGTDLWERILDAPYDITDGASVTLDPGGNLLVHAGPAGDVCRFRVEDNRWDTPLIDLLGKTDDIRDDVVTGMMPSSSDGQLAWTGNTLFAMPGQADPWTIRYAMDEWATEIWVPDRLYPGSSMIGTPDGKGLFVLQGNDGDPFLEAQGRAFWYLATPESELIDYSIQGREWNKLQDGTPFDPADLPAGHLAAPESCLCRSAGGEAIYALVRYVGDPVARFRILRYAIAWNEWTVIAEVPHEIGAGASISCLPGTGDLYLITGGWRPEFLRVNLYNHLAIVTGPPQQQVPGAAIVAVGGPVREGDLDVTVPLGDADPEPLRAELQLAVDGAAFRDDAPIHCSAWAEGGAPGRIPLRDLEEGRTYRLRVRAVDPSGLASAWVVRDGAGPDFVVPPSANEPASTAATLQMDGITGRVIEAGGSTPNTSLRFQVQLADPDGDGAGTIEFEIRPAGEELRGEATDRVAAGADGWGEIQRTLGPGGYRWAARSLDRWNETTGWSLHAAAGSAFRVLAYGSSSAASPCPMSAAGLPAAVLALLGALAAAGRRG